MIVGHKHINAYIEIIKYLLEEGTYKKTADIQKYLTDIGVLTGKNPSSDRRLLSNYLNNLEHSGYIEAKYKEEEEYLHKGKKSQEWCINRRAFKKVVSFTEDTYLGFVASYNFLPEKYSNTLPSFQKIKNLIDNLSFDLESDLRKRVEVAFKYVPELDEKSSKIDQEILNKIYQAIIKDSAIIVVYKKEKRDLRVFPIGVFIDNGLFYLKTIDLNSKDYKVLRIDLIKSVDFTNLTLEDRTTLRANSKLLEDKIFRFEDEELFIFAFDIEKNGLDYSSLEDFKFVETQFHLEEIDDKTLRVYLVGFTGRRFAERMLLLNIIRFHKPDINIMEVAKKHGKEIEGKYWDISFRLNENKYRYEKFIETYSSILDEKINKFKKTQEVKENAKE